MDELRNTIRQICDDLSYDILFGMGDDKNMIVLNVQDDSCDYSDDEQGLRECLADLRELEITEKQYDYDIV